MAWTIAETIDAVADTLGATTGITRTQSYNEIGDTVNDADCPLLQVYLNDLACDPIGDTAQSTLNAELRQYTIPAIVDIYLGPQNQFSERNSESIDILDALVNKLEDQTGLSKFGVTHIRAFSYTWTRSLFVYNEINYVGARMTITLRCW